LFSFDKFCNEFKVSVDVEFKEWVFKDFRKLRIEEDIFEKEKIKKELSTIIVP